MRFAIELRSLGFWWAEMGMNPLPSSSRRQKQAEFVLPPGYPPDLIRITGMQDAIEILRSDKFRMEPVGREAPLREGTLLKLDGDIHHRRRRVANRLVRREWHQRYRQDTLIPTLDRRMAQLRAYPDSDGVVRFDLVEFSRSLFLDMAVELVGLAGAESDEGRALLAGLIEPMHQGSVIKWFPDTDAVMGEALAALDVFRERFFKPSLAKRMPLIERFHRGEIADADLPNDLMTLVALRADPAWEDDELAIRTVVFYLAGASHTHVRPLGFVVDELERWFERHPEDHPLRIDPPFLKGAIDETLRMYGNTPALFRIATDDVALASGLRIRNGQFVTLDTRLTGRDTAVYGPDADDFNPRRKAPEGFYPFGLAFGSGDHMCQGLPIVLGVEGIDGTLLLVVRTLYSSGLARDPNKSASKVPIRDSYEYYPVMLELGGNG
jgi:cytochrome P450